MFYGCQRDVPTNTLYLYCLTDFQLQLVKLINRAVQADGAVNLLDMLERAQPNISIFQKNF
ncbi:Uncharacterised protein [[Pasteurella] mairii]|uniref:Uncharacterized protein n=1 Tax=[Pasteurella] mairii TaxID=757 RepID=A0A379B337_9PAST|nr:Uncharacterised protein [[Pasteurella] mairii]